MSVSCTKAWLIPSRSFELRLKRSWNAPSQNPDDALPEKQPMWVLTSIFPELNEEGEVIEIIGCYTDIRYESRQDLSKILTMSSQQKWSEEFQAQQAARARESKR